MLLEESLVIRMFVHLSHYCEFECWMLQNNPTSMVAVVAIYDIIITAFSKTGENKTERSQLEV